MHTVVAEGCRLLCFVLMVLYCQGFLQLTYLVGDVDIPCHCQVIQSKAVKKWGILSFFF